MKSEEPILALKNRISAVVLYSELKAGSMSCTKEGRLANEIMSELRTREFGQYFFLPTILVPTASKYANDRCTTQKATVGTFT